MKERVLRFAAVVTGTVTLVAFGLTVYLVQTEDQLEDYQTGYERARRLPRLVTSAVGCFASAALMVHARRPQTTIRRMILLGLLVVTLIFLLTLGIPTWYQDVMQQENGGSADAEMRGAAP